MHKKHGERRSNGIMMRVVGVSMLVGLCGTGCVNPPKKAYDGPKLPPDQEVRVISQYKPVRAFIQPHPEFVYVQKIDGESISQWGNFFRGWGPYANEVTVAPGMHMLTLRYRYFNRGAYGDVRLDAMPGKTYRIRLERLENNRISFWFEEASHE